MWCGHGWKKLCLLDEFMSGDDSVESTGCGRSLLHPVRCKRWGGGRRNRVKRGIHGESSSTNHSRWMQINKQRQTTKCTNKNVLLIKSNVPQANITMLRNLKPRAAILYSAHPFNQNQPVDSSPEGRGRREWRPFLSVG